MFNNNDSKKNYLKLISLLGLFSIILSLLSFSFAFKQNETNAYFASANETKLPKIIIDAGHGGEDCGAIGKSGVYEKDLNLEIAFLLKQYLENSGYIAIMTRTTDRLMYTEEENIKGMRKIYDLKNRVKIANSYENALLVSIHMNSFQDSRYKGLQVYYVNTDSAYRLAGSIQSEVKRLLQNDNKRQIKNGNELYLLENSENPAVLIECGFISNEEECKKLSQKEYQKELCFSILCGIIKYVNEGNLSN